MILRVADLSAFGEVSPRVRPKTSEVLPRPTTLNTRTTLASTSASEIWRTTFESYLRASRHERPDFFAAWGRATATSCLGAVWIVEPAPAGRCPTGVESAPAVTATASATTAIRPAARARNVPARCLGRMMKVILFSYSRGTLAGLADSCERARGIVVFRHKGDATAST